MLLIDNKTKKKELARRYKLKKGCAICGYKKHASALEFDHLDPKLKTRGVCRMTQMNTSIKTMKKEIRKCRVLCSNCHKVHTSKQRFSHTYMRELELSMTNGLKQIFNKKYGYVKERKNDNRLTS